VYSIYANDVCIYHDIFVPEDMAVLNPKLTMEDNSAGSLSITLPPANKAYGSITRMATDISVRKHDKEIWSGRVLSEDSDFWNNRVLYCEGELAFLNDSTQPPAEYSRISIREYLQRILDVHNSKVPDNRRIEIGAVTVTEEDESIVRYTNYEKTLKYINDLVEEYGGHIRIRKEGGVRYLDYLKDYPKATGQRIEFGKNLMDFTRKWDSTEYATVIVPLGARQSDSPIEALDAYLTVASENNGCIYVQSEDAVKSFGWIEKVVNWDDIESPASLLKKARDYLADLQFDNMDIELSALDLHYLNPDMPPVELLDEIRVVSRPHGMDRFFPVTKLEIPLDHPEDTLFTLGDRVQTNLTSVNNQVSSSIRKRIDSLPKEQAILKEAKDNATQIMKMATTGYITIVQDEYGSDTLYISNDRDYSKASKLWKWSMNGLGYSNDGGKTFGLAITMDGSIVADYITTGTLNADLIRAGVLKDYYENFYLDLKKGDLIIKKGSIDLGDGNFVATSDGNITVKGTIYASAGEIAGFTIEPEYMHTGGGNYYVSMNGSDTNQYKDYAFWAGNPDAGKAPFWVKKNGEFYASKGTFNGKLEAATGNFTGIVQASDFLDSDGNSMLIGQKFSPDYLDLYGLTIRDKSTGLETFKIDSNGNVTMSGTLEAATGNFIGIVQASDFLDHDGNSMLTGRKFSSNYLDLYGLTVRDIETDAVTFQVDENGKITINGSITMGAGSTIDWAQVGNQNIASNPAYAAAEEAKDLALLAIDSLPILPSYIESTKITSTRIESPEIYGGTFYGNKFNVIADGDKGSFNLYANIGEYRFNAFAIDYYMGDRPEVSLYSPAKAYINIGSANGTTVSFQGNVDFSNANVTGL